MFTGDGALRGALPIPKDIELIRVSLDEVWAVERPRRATRWWAPAGPRSACSVRVEWRSSGEYTAGRSWFDQDESITFAGGSYQKSGGEVRLICPDIRRVGEYQGVPLFVRRDATAPYLQFYVPVRPGVWHMYENLRGTRG